MENELVRQSRGGIDDLIFRGAIRVTDGAGRCVARVGEAQARVYLRSSAKPIQALPFIELGLAERYGLTEDELVLTGASHWGEAGQVSRLESLFAKLGLREEDMVLGASLPIERRAQRAVLLAGGAKRKIYHNCAGKHASLMAVARALGDAPGSYWLPESRVGRRVLKTIAYFTGEEPGEIGIGVDGCGVPVFAVPLESMCAAYVRLADPARIDDASLRSAAQRMTAAYHAYPEIMGAHGTLCQRVNSDPNLVGKLGADGLYCLGLKKEGLGLALKLEDGNMSQSLLALILSTALRQLGYTGAGTQALEALAEREVLCSTGAVVGELRTTFSL